MMEHILASTRQFQPETALVAAFCVAILVDLVMKGSRTAPAWVALLGLAAAGVLLPRQAASGTVPIFDGMYVVDPLSMFFKGVVLLAAVLIVLFSMQSTEVRSGSRSSGEYYALLVAMTLGMFLMTGSGNLLMMYLSLELTSISSYILAGYMKRETGSSEASLKYVIYGALSSGLMLYGISILYGLTGTADIVGIQQAIRTGSVSSVALVISGVLMIAGFGYKISAVPFHFWTPDVYEGAPITITAFLSVASKAAGFAMMIRFFSVSLFHSGIDSVAAGGISWDRLLAVISVLTMTLGNLVALWQNNLKRMLAYSSIAHAGTMLLGVVVMNNQGIAAVLVYFAVYLFMNLGAFYVVMLVANRAGREDIEAYNGLGKRSPLLAVAFTIFLLSLTGIPPTAGFIGKLYLFASLIQAKWIWLAVIGVLNSVISLYYYVRVVRNMFLRDPEEGAGPFPLPAAHVVMLLVLLVPTILLGLYFTPLVEMAQASVGMFGSH